MFDINAATQKLEDVSERSQISKVPVEVSPTPTTPIELTHWTLFRADPNLALASLRIDIEKKLREIVIQKDILFKRPYLRSILSALYSEKIISHSDFETLSLIINICNKAVYAEKVDPSTA